MTLMYGLTLSEGWRILSQPAPLEAHVNILAGRLAYTPLEDLQRLNQLIHHHRDFHWCSKKTLVSALRPSYPFEDGLYEDALSFSGDALEVLAIGIPEGEGGEAYFSDLDNILPNRPRKDELSAALQQLWATYDSEHRYLLARLVTGNLKLYAYREVWCRALSMLFEIDLPTVSRFASVTRSSGWEQSYLTYLARRPHPFIDQVPKSSVGDDLSLVDVVAGGSDYLVSPIWPGLTVHAVYDDTSLQLYTADGLWCSAHYGELMAALHDVPPHSHLMLRVVSIEEGLIGDASLAAKRLLQPPPSDAVLKKSKLAAVILDVYQWDDQPMSDVSYQKRQQHILDHRQSSFDHPLLIMPTCIATAIIDSTNEVSDLVRQYQAIELHAYRAEEVLTYHRILSESKSIVATLRYVRREVNDPAGRDATFTLAVMDGDEYVPILNAAFDDDDKSNRRLLQYAMKHTEERFGPVRQVTPGLLVRVTYTGVRRAGRSKAGLKLVDASLETILEEVEAVTALAALKDQLAEVG